MEKSQQEKRTIAERKRKTFRPTHATQGGGQKVNVGQLQLDANPAVGAPPVSQLPVPYREKGCREARKRNQENIGRK